MKRRKSNLFRGLASIFLAFLVIFYVVGQVATSWSGKVNELLGLSDDSIERTLNEADYRYTSDFADPASLITAEIALNTRLAAEGSVSLKGTPALPGTKVTLFGMRSGSKMQFGGSMGELVDASNVVTLATAMEANGFSVNPDMVQFYVDMEADYAPTRSAGGNVVNDYDEQGAAIGEVPIANYDAAMLEGYKDAAVIVLGRDAGESACFYPGENGQYNPDDNDNHVPEFTNSPTGNILSLSDDERDLVRWVEKQGFEKIVVLLNVASAMEIEELKTDSAIDGILWIGNPGAYGTYGIAKLLSGEILPSGHLADTFAVNTALSPAARNLGIYVFANADEIETTTNNALRSSWYLAEEEGIYTGYKYYETRYFDTVFDQGNAFKAAHGEAVKGNTWDYDNEVSYTFGFGLEGSDFTEEITGTDIDWSGEKDSTVTVRVTNTGDAAAKHAVQLYVSLPYTDYDKENGIEKSAIQLVGYAKTGEAKEESYADVVLLAPRESEELTISFNAQDIYSYDRTYAHDDVAGAWLLEEGDYYFATGNGAHDALQAVILAMDDSAISNAEPTGDVHRETVDAQLVITESNGTLVQNELDEADLNTWNADAGITWLSRSDWAGTFPESLDTLTATPEMIVKLRNETYDAAVELAAYEGPTSFTYGANNGVLAVDLIGRDFDDPLYEKVLDEMTVSDYIKQYTAYIEDIPQTAMPKEYPADSPLGIIGTIGQHSAGTIYEVSADTEGYGHFTNVYVGAPVVAATFSPLLQSEEGRLIANDALWSGYNCWFGPGLNLHRTPYNGRNIAYYSEDSVLTGLTATYVHRSTSAYGITTNTKHFAFNDQETNRDGLALFLNEQAARENELRGFQIPIRDGSLHGLMSAFNRIGLTHVAAHRGLMNGILRGEWGWNGYLMTDSVKSAKYFLPKECLLAGNDFMLGGSNNAKTWGLTEEAVLADPVIQAGLRDAYHRKLYNFVNSAVMNGISQDSSAANAKTWWELALQIILCASIFFFLLFTVLFIVAHFREKKKDLIEKGRIFSLPVIVSICLTLLGTALFLLSFTTNYYILGQMNSVLILVLLGAALAAEILSVIFLRKSAEKLWPWFFTFAVTACLAAAAMLIIGDRVEGIGNCIVSDYDSGHGGEEAIYYSLGGSVVLLLAMTYNIIAVFGRVKGSKTKGWKVAVFTLIAAVLAVAAVVTTLILTGTINVTKFLARSSQGNTAGTVTESKTYTVSYNVNNENAGDMVDYQFLCSDFSGMVNADSRFYVDLTLTLDGAGKYTLFSDAYVIEGGKRTTVGDDSGLGLVLTTTAEGSYHTDGNGVVTTEAAEHAVFEMQTDTYSGQMKAAANMNVDGNDADGVYDSSDVPAVLDFVPATVWTLEDGAIVSYSKQMTMGVYTVSYNVNNENAGDMADYQFLCSNFAGMVNADSRFYVDLTLELDGTGNYSLFSDAYVIEGGKRTEVGDDSGLGLVLTTKAEGTYSEDEDGNVVTAQAEHAVFEMQTDTYSGQMKAAANMNVDGNDADGVYDSADVPAVLDFVPETVWTLSDGAILSYYDPNAEEEEESTEAQTEEAETEPESKEEASEEEEESSEAGEAPALTQVDSEDGATNLTFYEDGTYKFSFPSYNIDDFGTYTYEDGKLVLTDANGKETEAEGDPLEFTYAYSMSDQLTGSFSVEASALAGDDAQEEAEEEESSAAEAEIVVQVDSEDGATNLTFYEDGTYKFSFPSYNIDDFGTYTYEDGKLVLTDANGKETEAEGDPLTFTYAYSMSDQLTGTFSVGASDLEK